ncbi:LuxR family transcriptional regulator [Thioclava sp. BHET1]|nr:LuxR family transcriptional regulator [Thioclava sp. BHET1]
MRPSEYQATFSRIAPAGYYIALRLGFYAPEEEVNTFPKAWVEHYTAAGLALFDPFLQWCHANSGARRWGEIDLPDPVQVIPAYKEFGLAYGAVVSVQGTPQRPRRSFGVFARFEREFHSSELEELQDILIDLHQGAQQSLTEAQREVLRMVSSGLRQKQIAHALGISLSAVKSRLKSAADRLEAKTPAEAAYIATTKGLL